MAVNGRRRRRCAAARRLGAPLPSCGGGAVAAPPPAALHELRERPPIDRQAGSAARRLGEGREEAAEVVHTGLPVRLSSASLGSAFRVMCPVTLSSARRLLRERSSTSSKEGDAHPSRPCRRRHGRARRDHRQPHRGHRGLARPPRPPPPRATAAPLRIAEKDERRRGRGRRRRPAPRGRCRRTKWTAVRIGRAHGGQQERREGRDAIVREV